jgi:hypothetical protein
MNVTPERDIVIRHVLTGVFRGTNKKLWKYDEHGVPGLAYVGRELSALLRLSEDAATKLLRGYVIPDKPFPASKYVSKKRPVEEEIEARIDRRFSLVTRGAYIGLWDENEARVVDLFKTENEARAALKDIKLSMEAWEDAPAWPSRKTKYE